MTVDIRVGSEVPEADIRIGIRISSVVRPETVLRWHRGGNFLSVQEAGPKNICYVGDYLGNATTGGALAIGRRTARKIVEHWQISPIGRRRFRILRRALKGGAECGRGQFAEHGAIGSRKVSELEASDVSRLTVKPGWPCCRR